MPGDVVVVECGLDDGVEGPSADDVVGLGSQVGWVEVGHAVAVFAPAGEDLGGE